MIGREHDVATLCSLLGEAWLASVVGPGGIGKTTVALAVAQSLRATFDDDICFVDLAAVNTPDLVPCAVAAACGIRAQTSDPLPSLLAALEDRRILLILDNCERLIDAVAELTTQLCRSPQQLHLLTTSREPLHIEGERIYLLPPLRTPDERSDLTVAEALDSPAIRLFMDRAAASGHTVELSDGDALVVADICRGLDGIPLAIELAANRVGTYGIAGTASLLSDGLRLLHQGRRDPVARHQTLHAMLAWSYNLLTERDRLVLGRLSIFAGRFTPAGARSVCCDAELSQHSVNEAVASLVDKSLISVSVFEGSISYRLLETTRAFATTELAAREEVEIMARRHALHCCDSLQVPARGSLSFCRHDFSTHASQLGDIRKALEWSLSQGGDASLGVRLVARATALFLQPALLNECFHWCARALALLEPAEEGPGTELTLQVALAISAVYTQGNGLNAQAAIDRGLILAEQLGDGEREVELLAGLHMLLGLAGKFREALAVAERCSKVARRLATPLPLVIADWMVGGALHFLGDQRRALRRFERGLNRGAVSAVRQVDVFGYNHRVRTLVLLARTTWLIGAPDRAAVIARQAIEAVASGDHAVNLCIALIYATTVDLWRGDLTVAGNRIEQVIKHSALHALWPHHSLGLALQGELAIAEGRPADGLERLSEALGSLRTSQHQILAPGLYCALASGLRQSGRMREAAVVLNLLRRRVCAQPDSLYAAEFWRIRGELPRRDPEIDVSLAEASLGRSLAIARTQGALSFELRAAMSLAKLYREQQRNEAAVVLLSTIYNKFNEGFDTADLVAARNLLADLGYEESQGTTSAEKRKHLRIHRP
jgi:predicted ATPase